MAKAERNETPVTEYVPGNARDIPGLTADDPHGASGVEEQADQLIRRMMTEQKSEASLNALPELSPAPEKPGPKPCAHPRKSSSSAGAEDAVEALMKAEKQNKFFARRPNRVSKSNSGTWWMSVRLMLSRASTYRPSRKHIFFAVIALIAVMRPLLIPVVLFVSFWVVLICYLTLGPDRVAELVVGAWYKLRQHRPELAESIRHRADNMAVRIDALLDLLPETWTDGLYLPDLSKSAVDARDEESRSNPFQKLTSEARQI